MLRSFNERVFGGVCGGLAAALRVNAWLVRMLFVLLTLLSLGAFVVVYVVLWWVVPAQSFVERKRGFPTVLALLLIILISAAYLVVTYNLAPLPLTIPAGVNPFWLGSAVMLSGVFLLRQLRG